jgi:type I restriction enzyme S subunit
MNERPHSWVTARLDEIADVILGQSPPGSSYNEDGAGVAFFQGKAEFGDLRPEVRKWTTAPKKVAAADDVLMSVRAPVGPTNLAPGECAIGRGLTAIHPRGGIDSRYVLYGIRSTSDRLAALATGTTFSAVSGDVVKAHLLPVAPLAEQRRIVAAIEEQLSRLEAAEECLRRCKVRLAALRRSVLAEAVRGPWSVTRLGDLLENIVAGKSFRTTGQPAKPSEWGVIKVSAMTWGEFNEDENKAIPPGRVTDARYEIRSGDLLLSRANTSDYVGATVLVRSCRPKLLLSDKSMRLVSRPNVDRRWLWYALSSPQLRAQMSAVATGTSDSMRNISQEKVRALSLPLPPLAEQLEIVDVIERRMSIVDAEHARIVASLSRSEALRRSVLREAFAGGLVKQDPTDEPASVLLDRIAADGRGSHHASSGLKVEVR